MTPLGTPQKSTIFCQRNHIMRLRCHHHCISSSGELGLCPKVWWVWFRAAATGSFGHVVVPAHSHQSSNTMRHIEHPFTCLVIFYANFSCSDLDDDYDCADDFPPSCWCTRQPIVHRRAALAVWKPARHKCDSTSFFSQVLFPHLYLSLTLLVSHVGRRTLRQHWWWGRRETRKKEEAFCLHTTQIWNLKERGAL